MSGAAVGRIEEIPVGEGRVFVVDGTQIAVFRLRDGSVRAVQAICPHRGGPLADGLIDEELVVCPLHGNAYRLSDGCSPTGQPTLRSYAAEVDADGTLRVCARERVLDGVPAVAGSGERPPVPEGGAGRPV